MSVQTEATSVEYVGNGAARNFPVPFKFLDSEDLVVTLHPPASPLVTLVQGVDYTVDGASEESGGSVNLLATPAYQAVVKVQRSMAVVQPLDLRTQGTFSVDVHETAFDRLTMLIQQCLRGQGDLRAEMLAMAAQCCGGQAPALPDIGGNTLADLAKGVWVGPSVPVLTSALEDWLVNRVGYWGWIDTSAVLGSVPSSFAAAAAAASMLMGAAAGTVTASSPGSFSGTSPAVSMLVTAPRPTLAFTGSFDGTTTAVSMAMTAPVGTVSVANPSQSFAGTAPAASMSMAAPAGTCTVGAPATVIEVVGTGAASQTTSASVGPVALPAGILDSDLLVAVLAGHGTVSTPAGWTLLSNVSGRVAVFYKWHAGGSAPTFTVQADSNAKTAYIAAFRGVHATTPMDAASPATNSAAGTSVTVGSPNGIATQTADALVLLAAGFPVSDVGGFNSPVLSVNAATGAATTEVKKDTYVSGYTGIAAGLWRSQKAISGNTGTSTASVTDSGGADTPTAAGVLFALRPA